ncbi:nucleotidyltransferase family protein [Aggregicoccus sp. 17bor-14]|uniref:nucleotidyltransferase family protein n=1 Tax=Myxococcaceae TaxID=31 RepID=UPI00129C1623|nr:MULTISPECIES: nucleotidyltransferase family protein [Myxococcaceae]MBF5045027.1 nucleotidyltransferase family protein [Simulacricoccus sp. 17bor-14]MRI90770.1 nucleotidyltransferase family protein [Aggregicoccus sp. 17bor-14]
MAPPSLLDTVRVLASLDPPRTDLRGAPWEQYVDWSIGQGLAPLAAYNLQYRLGAAGAPEWARDRLLSIYQGSLNDNVMKLVNFKRAVDELEGRRLLMLGGAAFAEALYPHVGFRPVLEIQLLLQRTDLDPFAAFLGQHQFKPEPDDMGSGAARVLSDGRTPVFLFSDVLGARGREALRGVFERARPMRVYGPSFFRPEQEDAVLLLCLEHARQGYEVPLLSFVDLRELVTGAQGLNGPYSRPLDAASLQERARAWRLERALYASLAVVAGLFPEAAAAARAAQPPLRGATRQLLDRLVVAPTLALGRTRTLRGGDRLRRLLTGQ